VAKGRFRKRGFPLNSRAAQRQRPRKTTGVTIASISENRCKTRSFFDRAGSHARLFLFHHALQGMLVLARKIHHLRDFGLGNLVGKHAALADTVMMDVQHDLGRGFGVLLEELLQQ